MKLMDREVSRPYLLAIETDPDRVRAVQDAGRSRGLGVYAVERLRDPRVERDLQDPMLAAVMLDPHLEDGDGLRMIERVRAERRGLPVLVLSAPGADESLRRAESLGVRGFCFDPLRPREVARWIDANLRLIVGLDELAPLKKRILIVDDDEDAIRAVQDAARAIGYLDGVAHTARAALDVCESGDWSGVVIDPWMDGQRGFQVLRRVHSARPGLPVVWFSARSDSPERDLWHSAIGTLVSKPAGAERLLVALRDLLPLTLQGLRSDPTFSRFWAVNAKMLATLDRVREVAGRAGDVMLDGRHGESSVAIAQAIHARSPGKHGPFVEVNAAHLRPQELPSLFRGEAPEGKPRGWTLYLGDLQELDRSCWTDLARELDRRDQDHRECPRIIASSISGGNPFAWGWPDCFGIGNLHSRINRHLIRVPGLDARSNDIRLLAEVYRDQANVELGRQTIAFDEGLLCVLSWSFRGDETELRDFVFAGVQRTQGDVVIAEAMGEEMRALVELAVRNQVVPERTPRLEPAPDGTRLSLASVGGRSLTEPAILA